MKINYDSKANALYIKLSKGKYDSTKKITDSVLVDITRNGKVIGIEILDASENIDAFNPSKGSIKFQNINLTHHQI